MANTGLLVTGKVVGQKHNMYDNKPYCVLQVMGEATDGSVSFMEVSMPDGANLAEYEKGRDVSIPVMAAVNKYNKVVLRAVLPKTAASQSASAINNTRRTPEAPRTTP
ncbi:hypothetical protein GJ689_21480 [Rhodoplanes serenus]|uniref:Uncharacterized protein n=1 Tax=Rhodoplanes serenus TaxID=200615 RepID=A0A9X4XTX2_9BRAD|nr:hypothetical protein [Rhodoplanes serenus]MTW18776.1 hypothetical protein [Rhodoplanes serenus]